MCDIVDGELVERWDQLCIVHNLVSAVLESLYHSPGGANITECFVELWLDVISLWLENTLACCWRSREIGLHVCRLVRHYRCSSCRWRCLACRTSSNRWRMSCCSTKIMWSLPSLSFSSLLGTVYVTLTSHIHMTILISACWSATSFSFLISQVSLPWNILFCTQLLLSLIHISEPTRPY